MLVKEVAIIHEYSTLFADVRNVDTGHRMVEDGWKMFEEVVSEGRVGELPQLLRSLRGMTTPLQVTPPPVTPTSMGTTLPPMDQGQSSSSSPFQQ